MHRQILNYKSIPGIFGENADSTIMTGKLKINQKHPELLENKKCSANRKYQIWDIVIIN